GRLAVGGDAYGAADRGVERGLGLGGERLGLVVARHGFLQRGVGLVDLALEAGQGRIAVEGPPVAAAERVGRRGLGPRAGLLESGRGRRGGDLVPRREGAPGQRGAGGNAERPPGRRRQRTSAHHAFPAPATRTTSPPTIESGGLAITASP